MATSGVEPICDVENTLPRMSGAPRTWLALRTTSDAPPAAAPDTMRTRRPPDLT